MDLPQERIYTIEDFYNLPEGIRAELINDKIYMQASPSANHQRLSLKLTRLIADYIDARDGDCEVFPAPFDVFLSGNENECFIPDISVICNPDLIKDRGCYGAPDWIIEIVSPSTASLDYFLKPEKYRIAGVKEYWIINLMKHTVTVYHFEDENFSPRTYSFQDNIKTNIYSDLIINFSGFSI